MTEKLVPFKPIETEWSAFLELAQAPYVISNGYGEALRARMLLAESNWRIIAHWLYNFEYDREYKIPVPRKVANGWRPFAEIIYSLEQLCKESQFHWAKRGIDYNGAAEFIVILFEWKCYGLIEALEGSGRKGEGLVRYRGEVRDEWNLLKGWENPFNPDKMPHTYKLIEIALKLRKIPNFDRDYWQPLVSAFKAWKEVLDKSKESGVRAMREVDGLLHLQQGKGKISCSVRVLLDSPRKSVVQLPMRVKKRSCRTCTQ